MTPRLERYEITISKPNNFITMDFRAKIVLTGEEVIPKDFKNVFIFDH
jgi:hypothetical protein